MGRYFGVDQIELFENQPHVLLDPHVIEISVTVNCHVINAVLDILFGQIKLEHGVGDGHVGPGVVALPQIDLEVYPPFSLLGFGGTYLSVGFLDYEGLEYFIAEPDYETAEDKVL